MSRTAGGSPPRVFARITPTGRVGISNEAVRALDEAAQQIPGSRGSYRVPPTVDRALHRVHKNAEKRTPRSMSPVATFFKDKESAQRASTRSPVATKRNALVDKDLEALYRDSDALGGWRNSAHDRKSLLERTCGSSTSPHNSPHAARRTVKNDGYESEDYVEDIGDMSVKHQQMPSAPYTASAKTAERPEVEKEVRWLRNEKPYRPLTRPKRANSVEGGLAPRGYADAPGRRASGVQRPADFTGRLGKPDRLIENPEAIADPAPPPPWMKPPQVDLDWHKSFETLIKARAGLEAVEAHENEIWSRTAAIAGKLKELDIDDILNGGHGSKSVPVPGMEKPRLQLEELKYHAPARFPKAHEMLRKTKSLCKPGFSRSPSPQRPGQVVTETSVFTSTPSKGTLFEDRSVYTGAGEKLQALEQVNAMLGAKLVDAATGKANLGALLDLVARDIELLDANERTELQWHLDTIRRMCSKSKTTGDPPAEGLEAVASEQVKQEPPTAPGSVAAAPTASSSAVGGGQTAAGAAAARSVASNSPPGPKRLSLSAVSGKDKLAQAAGEATTSPKPARMRMTSVGEVVDAVLEEKKKRAAVVVEPLEGSNLFDLKKLVAPSVSTGLVIDGVIPDPPRRRRRKDKSVRQFKSWTAMFDHAIGMEAETDETSDSDAERRKRHVEKAKEATLANAEELVNARFKKMQRIKEKVRRGEELDDIAQNPLVNVKLMPKPQVELGDAAGSPTTRPRSRSASPGNQKQLSPAAAERAAFTVQLPETFEDDITGLQEARARFSKKVLQHTDRTVGTGSPLPPPGVPLLKVQGMPELRVEAPNLLEQEQYKQAAAGLKSINMPQTTTAQVGTSMAYTTASFPAKQLAAPSLDVNAVLKSPDLHKRVVLGPGSAGASLPMVPGGAQEVKAKANNGQSSGVGKKAPGNVSLFFYGVGESDASVADLEEKEDALVDVEGNNIKSRCSEAEPTRAAQSGSHDAQQQQKPSGEASDRRTRPASPTNNALLFYGGFSESSPLGGMPFMDRNTAASKIQAVERGNQGRRLTARRNSAATTIQSTRRSLVVQREVNRYREELAQYELETQMLSEAATQIQAVHRGNSTRRSVQQMIVDECDAATKIQAVQRQKQGKRDADAQREHLRRNPRPLVLGQFKAQAQYAEKGRALLPTQLSVAIRAHDPVPAERKPRSALGTSGRPGASPVDGGGDGYLHPAEKQLDAKAEHIPRPQLRMPTARDFMPNSQQREMKHLVKMLAESGEHIQDLVKRVHYLESDARHLTRDLKHEKEEHTALRHLTFEEKARIQQRKRSMSVPPSLSGKTKEETRFAMEGAGLNPDDNPLFRKDLNEEVHHALNLNARSSSLPQPGKHHRSATLWQKTDGPNAATNPLGGAALLAAAKSMSEEAVRAHRCPSCHTNLPRHKKMSDNGIVAGEILPVTLPDMIPQAWQAAKAAAEEAEAKQRKWHKQYSHLHPDVHESKKSRRSKSPQPQLQQPAKILPDVVKREKPPRLQVEDLEPFTLPTYDLEESLRQQKQAAKKTPLSPRSLTHPRQVPPPQAIGKAEYSAFGGPPGRQVRLLFELKKAPGAPGPSMEDLEAEKLMRQLKEADAAERVGKVLVKNMADAPKRRVSLFDAMEHSMHMAIQRSDMSPEKKLETVRKAAAKNLVLFDYVVKKEAERLVAQWEQEKQDRMRNVDMQTRGLDKPMASARPQILKASSAHAPVVPSQFAKDGGRNPLNCEMTTQAGPTHLGKYHDAGAQAVVPVADAVTDSLLAETTREVAIGTELVLDDEDPTKDLTVGEAGVFKILSSLINKTREGNRNKAEEEDASAAAAHKEFDASAHQLDSVDMWHDFGGTHSSQSTQNNGEVTGNLGPIEGVEVSGHIDQLADDDASVGAVARHEAARDQSGTIFAMSPDDPAALPVVACRAMAAYASTDDLVSHSVPAGQSAQDVAMEEYMQQALWLVDDAIERGDFYYDEFGQLVEHRRDDEEEDDDELNFDSGLLQYADASAKQARRRKKLQAAALLAEEEKELKRLREAGEDAAFAARKNNTTGMGDMSKLYPEFYAKDRSVGDAGRGTPLALKKVAAEDDKPLTAPRVAPVVKKGWAAVRKNVAQTRATNALLSTGKNKKDIAHLEVWEMVRSKLNKLRDDLPDHLKDDLSGLQRRAAHGEAATYAMEEEERLRREGDDHTPLGGTVDKSTSSGKSTTLSEARRRREKKRLDMKGEMDSLSSLVQGVNALNEAEDIEEQKRKAERKKADEEKARKMQEFLQQATEEQDVAVEVEVEETVIDETITHNEKGEQVVAERLVEARRRTEQILREARRKTALMTAVAGRASKTVETEPVVEAAASSSKPEEAVGGSSKDQFPSAPEGGGEYVKDRVKHLQMQLRLNRVKNKLKGVSALNSLKAAKNVATIAALKSSEEKMLADKKKREDEEQAEKKRKEEEEKALAEKEKIAKVLAEQNSKLAQSSKTLSKIADHPTLAENVRVAHELRKSQRAVPATPKQVDPGAGSPATPKEFGPKGESPSNAAKKAEGENNSGAPLLPSAKYATPRSGRVSSLSKTQPFAHYQEPNDSTSMRTSSVDKLAASGGAPVEDGKKAETQRKLNGKRASVQENEPPAQPWDSDSDAVSPLKHPVPAAQDPRVQQKVEKLRQALPGSATTTLSSVVARPTIAATMLQPTRDNSKGNPNPRSGGPSGRGRTTGTTSGQGSGNRLLRKIRGQDGGSGVRPQAVFQTTGKRQMHTPEQLLQMQQMGDNAESSKTRFAEKVQQSSSSSATGAGGNDVRAADESEKFEDDNAPGTPPPKSSYRQLDNAAAEHSSSLIETMVLELDQSADVITTIRDQATTPHVMTIRDQLTPQVTPHRRTANLSSRLDRPLIEDLRREQSPAANPQGPRDEQGNGGPTTAGAPMQFYPDDDVGADGAINRITRSAPDDLDRYETITSAVAQLTQLEYDLMTTFVTGSQ